jgi:hypothetical protein
VSGVGLDEVVRVDVLDGARGRGRHPAVVLPLAASAVLREEVRCALLRLWALGFCGGARGWRRKDIYMGSCGLWAVGWSTRVKLVGCSLGLENGLCAQFILFTFFYGIE